MQRLRHVAAQPAATSDPEIFDEGSLQRSISLHWKFSPLDTRRSHLELQGQAYVYGLQRRKPSDRDGSSRSAPAIGTGASARGWLQKQELGRVLKTRCAETRFRFHGLRQRGKRGLPSMAGAANDGALGYSRPSG